MTFFGFGSGFLRRIPPINHLSDAFDDVGWDGKPYGHANNAEDWTGRALRQIHVPMLPQSEDAMRAFYLGLLGMIEMRAPDDAPAAGGFWAVSGTRQVYFGQSPDFQQPRHERPAFVYPNLDAIAQTLASAGHVAVWDTSLAYVRRLEVTDPAGNPIALIGA